MIDLKGAIPTFHVWSGPIIFYLTNNNIEIASHFALI